MATELRPVIRRQAKAGRAFAATSSDGHGGRLRRLARHGLPVLAVVLVTAFVATIALYIFDSNRRGAVALSNDLLAAIDRRIAVQMNAFLSPPEQFLQAAREIAGGQGVFGGGTAAETFALHTLPKIQQISGYSYGDPDGNFLYVVRNTQGGYDTKLIDRRGGGHKVTWTRRDATGRVVSTAEDPADTYDPRQRPWYGGATQSAGSYWSDPYLFFTLRQPGITHALPHYDAQKRLAAVSGVDIELTALGAFLKQLEIGVNGKAIVVDGSGRIVAYPGDGWLRGTRVDQPLPRLDELDDPLLTRVFNRLRIEGYGRKILEMADRRIVVSSEPLKALTGRDWAVLIVVPESDFVGFVAASGWTALAMSAVVVLVTLGLAGLLARRSVLAERRLRRADTRQGTLESWAAAFAELAASPDTIDRTTVAGVQKATERAATICRAKRVGVWHLTADGRSLACEDCFDRAARAHTSGMELHRNELPELFSALAEGQTIDTAHAGSDARTTGLAALYLDPLGIEGVHIAPVRIDGRLLGMVLVEEPRRGNRAAGLTEFCGALASLLALRFRPHDAGPPAAATIAAPEAEDAQRAAQQKVDRALAARKTALDRTLLHRSISVDAMASGRIDQAAVAVVKLPDWLATGQRGAENSSAARMDAMVEEIRSAIERSGLAYAALLDDMVVLAAFSGDAESIAIDARVTAMAAIDLRDRLADLTASWGPESEFRLAIDIGPIMVSSAAGHPAGRNLWGGAIGVARILASTGGRRAITVSEATYLVLSNDFLFRQVGAFFLPETGPMQTFLLVGEL